MKSKIYLLFVLMVTLLLSACATGKNYSGPTRPKSELATIIFGSPHTLPGMKPITINGNPANWATGWNSLSMQVLPGPVELIVAYDGLYVHGIAPRRITFNAAAGGEYVLEGWFENNRWGVDIMEKHTKQTIAEGVVCDLSDVQKDR